MNPQRKNMGDKDVDHGYAYIILLVCSLACFLNHIGMATSGVLFVQFLERFRKSHAVTSTPTSVLLCLCGLMGMISTVLINRFGYRPTIMFGFLLSSVAYFASSFAASIPYLIISYGVLAGAGHGITYIASLVPIQFYFKKKRALATAVCLAAQEGGVAIFNPVVQLLYDTFGLRVMFIAMSSAVLQGLALGALMRPKQLFDNLYVIHDEKDYPRHQSCPLNTRESCLNGDQNETLLESSSVVSGHTYETSTTGIDVIKKQCIENPDILVKEKSTLHSIKKFFNYEVFREKRFIIYLAGMFTLNLGQLTPYTYLPDRAKTLGINSDDVIIMVSSYGIAQIIGRLISGLIANIPKVDRVLQLSVVVGINGICMSLSPFCKTFVMLLIYAICYNLLFGCTVGVAYTVLVDLFGVENCSLTLGSAYTMVGLGYIVTIPLTGFIFDSTGSYDIPFYVNGGFVMMASVIFFTVFIINRKNNAAQRIQVSTDIEKKL